jgi:hypothetical protein
MSKKTFPITLNFKFTAGKPTTWPASALASLKKALSEVETGQGQNHLGTYGITSAVQDAERALDIIGLAKSDRPGAIFVHAAGGASCSSYRYAVPTTQAVLQRGPRCWKLVALSSIRQYPKAAERNDIQLTEAQAAKLTGPIAGFRNLRLKDGEVRKLHQPPFTFVPQEVRKAA